MNISVGRRLGRLSSIVLVPIMLAAAPPGRMTLGQFWNWGAFHDATPARCFAIAQPLSGGVGQASLTIATWPRLRVHDQLQVRLGRVATGDVTLETGGKRFALHARGNEAWAASPRDDARITAALRGGGLLQLRAVDPRGRHFRDRYSLDGAASAIDAMRLGCLPE